MLKWVQVLITRVQDVLHLDIFRILLSMRILVPLVETCAIAAIGLTALTDESWSSRIYLLQFFPLSSPPVCITGYILDSFRMAIYRIFPWCILVPSRFHEMVTSKVSRTMTIKAFWHNVLFVICAQIHFVPCDVCACCCYDKWTAQRVFTYSHWSDDALHKQDKNKHLDKSSIRFLANFSLSYFHFLCSKRSSFQFWQTQDKLGVWAISIIHRIRISFNPLKHQVVIFTTFILNGNQCFG